jgi:phenylacetate-CoA ligase
VSSADDSPVNIPPGGQECYVVSRTPTAPLDKLGVRVTVHAGEPGAGIPTVRARIEEAWGAKAYDHPGMTEMGADGFECQAQAGPHVNEAEFIAEVIDNDKGTGNGLHDLETNVVGLIDCWGA